MKLKLSTLFFASIALFSGITSGEVQAYFHSNEDGVEDLINTALTSEFGSLVDLKDDILSDDPALIELIGNSQESRGFDRNGNPLLSTKPLRELSKTLPNLRDFVDYKRNSILNSGTGGKLIENSNEIDDQMFSDLEKKDLQVRKELLGRLNTMSDTTFSSMSNQYRDGERMERIFSDSSNEVGSKAQKTLNKAQKARKIYQTKKKVNNWRDNNRYSKRRQMKSLNEWKTAMNERQENSNEEDNDISTTSTDNGSTVEKQGLFSDISGKLQPPTFSMSMSSKVSQKLVNSAASSKEIKYIEKKEQIEAKAAKQAEKKEAKIEKYIKKGKEVPEEWLEDDLYKTTTSDIFWNKYTEAGNSNARYFDRSGEYFNPSSPDFKPPEIPDHFEKTLAIKELDGAQYRCAWQAPITASNANYAYPDFNCNYLVYYARGITPNRPIRIKANFPPTEKVAYFSYQSSDIQSSFTIKSLKDYELIPSSGVNPYKSGTTSSSSVDSNTASSNSTTGVYGETIGDATSVNENRYEIWLSVTGQMGFENELGMLNNPETTDEDICNDGCSAVVILRYYTVKPGTNALTPDAYDDNRLFGFTAPPEVSQLDGTKDFKYKMPVQKGNKTKNVNVKHTLNSFSVLQTCDYEKPTIIGNAIGNYILQLLPEMEVVPYVNKRNNFVAFTGGAALFPNEDANYLWTTSYKPNLISANDPDYYNYEIIGKMRGKLPTVPHNEHPPFDKPRKYDMRYQSISSVAAIAGAPTINTLTAKDIELFYTGEVAEDLKATTHEWYNEQNYSIVFASSKGVASKCLGSEYVNDKDMFLTTTFDDIAQEHWGTVFRQVISKYQRTGLEDQSVAYAIEKCREKTETDDFNYCTSPEYLEEIMGPFYPKIDYFKCNIITGEMELLTDDMSQYNKQ
jgi:hypothetical protein